MTERDWRLNRGEYARIMRQVDQKPGGCWIWKGLTTPNGYGKVIPRPGERERVVHRVLWEYHAAALIPDGLELDHACHTEAVTAGRCPGGSQCEHRRCCNPAHLVLVTPSENTDRQAHSNRAKTHCPKGHPYDEANTAVRNGRRHCRACAAARSVTSVPSAP